MSSIRRADGAEGVSRMELTERQAMVILGALDVMGLGMTDDHHQWSQSERRAYENAIHIILDKLGYASGGVVIAGRDYIKAVSG